MLKFYINSIRGGEVGDERSMDVQRRTVKTNYEWRLSHFRGLIRAFKLLRLHFIAAWASSAPYFVHVAFSGSSWIEADDGICCLVRVLSCVADMSARPRPETVPIDVASSFAPQLTQSFPPFC
jgi:hypothetical protein